MYELYGCEYGYRAAVVCATQNSIFVTTSVGRRAVASLPCLTNRHSAMIAVATPLSMLLVATVAAKDLARPDAPSSHQLSSSPCLWRTDDFITPASAAHLLSRIPTDEAAFEPCLNQVHEFASKRCALLPVTGDKVTEALLTKLSATWDVDVARLVMRGLPIIRYLPGAPAVGLHGDEDRHGSVPNATLVLYLTDGVAR